MDALEKENALVATIHEQVEDAQVGHEPVLLLEHLVVALWLAPGVG